MVHPIPGGEIKRDPEIGKTAIQPEPAQTADLSSSGSHLISSLCRYNIEERQIKFSSDAKNVNSSHDLTIFLFFQLDMYL